MGIFDVRKKDLLIVRGTPRFDLPKPKTNLDKQLDEIAKKTMKDYKQVFKKLEKY